MLRRASRAPAVLTTGLVGAPKTCRQQRGFLTVRRSPRVRGQLLSSRRTLTVLEYFQQRPKWPGHASFLLTGISFLQPDLLALRLFATVSCALAILFNYFHPVGRPIWIPIQWNLFYICINISMAFQLLRDMNFRLSNDEQEIYDVFFRDGDSHLLSPREFHELLNLGVWSTEPQRRVLFKPGEMVDRLYLVYRGGVEFDITGKNTIIGPSMYGVSCFKYNKPTVATVTLPEGSRLVSWDIEELREHLDYAPRTKRALDALMDDIFTNRPDFVAHFEVRCHMAQPRRNTVGVSLLNRRVKYDVNAKGFEPILQGRLWKLLPDASEHAENNWFPRKSWLTSNGSHAYFSPTEKAELLFWIPSDIATFNIVSLSNAGFGCKRWVFEIWPGAPGRTDLKPARFAADTEAERDQWVAEIVRTQQMTREAAIAGRQILVPDDDQDSTDEAWGGS